MKQSYLLLIIGGSLLLLGSQESFAEESSDISIDELVDEYLALIEKLDGIGILGEDLVATPESINEIKDDLDRFKQIVIELQMRGFDGEANAERIDQQMVGIVTFFNKETQETLFEIQIPNGALSVFTIIGLIDEFEGDGVEITFEQKAALLKSGSAIVNAMTTFEDEEADDIASYLVYAAIGTFHPNAENMHDDSIQLTVILDELFSGSVPLVYAESEEFSLVEKPEPEEIEPSQKPDIQMEKSEKPDALRPKHQLDKGISARKALCEEGLELIQKSASNSYACVLPQTLEKLVERGWGISPLQKISVTRANCWSTAQEWRQHHIDVTVSNLDTGTSIDTNDLDVYVNDKKISPSNAGFFESSISPGESTRLSIMYEEGYYSDHIKGFKVVKVTGPSNTGWDFWLC